MRRPYALVYDALPQYPEEDIEAGIQAALEGLKRSVKLQQMIDAVRGYCEEQAQSRLEATLAQAQEIARQMPSTIEWKEGLEAERQRLREVERQAAQVLIDRVSALVARKVEEFPAHYARHRADYARFECMRARLVIVNGN